LFCYCTQVLHVSEHAAYRRIEAARIARRFPVILDLLAEGTITLTAVGLVAAHLTPDNHRDVLEAVRHKSKREVEHLVAGLCPQPPVPSVIRKLPARPQPASAGVGSAVPLVPYAAGGPSSANNLELRCRAHNAYEAERYFGGLLVREHVARWVTTTRSGPS
jgi:hypothetical protein